MNPKGDLPKLYLEPLIPREAYFGGRVNCTKMLYTCEGSELLFYMDATSMYPFVMCAFEFPIGKPDVRTRTGVLPHEHNFIPLEELFGLQKCTVIPPKHLYQVALPERDPVSAKVFLPFVWWLGIGLPYTHLQTSQHRCFCVCLYACVVKQFDRIRNR